LRQFLLCIHHVRFFMQILKSDWTMDVSLRTILLR
jgi:hypothetical protein